MSQNDFQYFANMRHNSSFPDAFAVVVKVMTVR